MVRERTKSFHLKNVCSGALWEIENAQKKKPISRMKSRKSDSDVAANPVQRHVMISYQWGVKERMVKLKDKLTKEDYKVWMDVDCMGLYFI